MVNFLTLNGSIRKNLGSGNTNRLRKEGNIPAVIYGNNGEDNIYIYLAKKDFDSDSCYIRYVCTDVYLGTSWRMGAVSVVCSAYFIWGSLCVDWV